jgi:hypothetical protein
MTSLPFIAQAFDQRLANQVVEVIGLGLCQRQDVDRSDIYQQMESNKSNK